MFRRRLTSFALQLYGRLRWRLSPPPQPFPDHHPHPQIGWPTALIHPHYPGLSSPRRERPEQQHTCSRPTGTCFITWPATPSWAKSRLVVGTRPSPQDLYPELVVLRPFDGMQHTLGRYKRQREELEQEEAPKKKRTHKQYKHKIH